MLRAFFDGSQSDQPGKVFVLAGYIAPVEAWAAFSADWQRVLDVPPAVNPFKVKFALKQRAEFNRCSEEQCNERIAMFRQVIEKHIPCEMALAFSVDAYQRAYADWIAADNKHSNPYFFANACVMPSIVRNLENFGLPREPIDFIFDNQDIEKPRIMEGWEWARQHSKNPDPPDLLKLLPNPPYFQDDERVLPLQAADMHVTWMRMYFESKLRKEELAPFPGWTKHLRGMLLTFNEQQLRDRANLELRG